MGKKKCKSLKERKKEFADLYIEMGDIQMVSECMGIARSTAYRLSSHINRSLIDQARVTFPMLKGSNKQKLVFSLWLKGKSLKQIHKATLISERFIAMELVRYEG